MKKKNWTKVTRCVWACDNWAVEDCDGYAELFRDGEFVRDFKTVEQAKRGATQRTLGQVAPWREQYKLKPPGLANLKVVAR